MTAQSKYLPFEVYDQETGQTVAAFNREVDAWIWVEWLDTRAAWNAGPERDYAVKEVKK